MSFVQDLTRNLALELVRVTEAAALVSGRFMGSGDKEGADQAVVNAMQTVLQKVDMNGIIIGEGEKVDAPMLYNGKEWSRTRSTIFEALKVTAPNRLWQVIPSQVGCFSVERDVFWAEDDVTSSTIDLDVPRPFWCSFYSLCEDIWPVIFAKHQGEDDAQTQKPIFKIWVLRKVETSNSPLNIRPPPRFAPSLIRNAG